MTPQDSHRIGDDVEDGRAETAAEKSARNWSDILQEFRVTQTGTQIISGFLLTLAFQSRFATLTDYQHATYVVLILLAATTTAVGLAPVSLHRSLFRRLEKSRTVLIGNRLLILDLILVSLLTAGVVFFIVDTVIDLAAGLVAGVTVLILLVVLLIVIPSTARRR